MSSVEAKVKDLEALQETAKELGLVVQQTEEVCQRQISQCKTILSECETELAFSQGLLVKAKVREAAAIVDLTEKEVRLTSLIAREAAALARDDFISAANIARQIPPAMEAVKKAEEELKKATKHRKDMEERVELAEKALHIAEEMTERTQKQVHHHFGILDELKQKANSRLGLASCDVHEYDAEKNITVKVQAWRQWKPEKHNLSSAMLGEHFSKMPFQVIEETLHEMYEKKKHFRDSVNELRISNTENPQEKHSQLETELALDLMEALVIQGVSSLAQDVQVRTCFQKEDGQGFELELGLDHLSCALEEGDFTKIRGKTQVKVQTLQGEASIVVDSSGKGGLVLQASEGMLKKCCVDFVFGESKE